MSHTSELGTSLPKTAPEPNPSVGASRNPRPWFGGAGENSYRASISNQTAREIFLAEGLRQDVADRFGVSRQLVSMIKYGKRYAEATADLRKDGGR